MDPANILPSLERLDDAVDVLEETLQPLIHNMTDVATKLPLLDKAKFYVLMTYSIESMLFSALRLNSVDAKEHPVFKELLRVRQYFEKIKNIEFPPQQKPEQTVNKEAAIRFIRSDLADDKEVHSKLTEMIAKERAKAALKTSRIGEKRKLVEQVASEKSNGEATAKDPSSDDESDAEAEADSESKAVPQKKVKVSSEDKPEKKSKKSRKEKGDRKKKKGSSKKASKD